MINEHYTPEAVILANGEYPTCPVPLTMLEEASFVACCDGAANEYISRGHTPDVIVGDGDSLSTEYHKRFSPIIHQIPDQETNDQTKAVRYLQKRGFRRIAIVGATGKREDHTLGKAAWKYGPLLIMEYLFLQKIHKPLLLIPDSRFPLSISERKDCREKDWFIR